MCLLRFVLAAGRLPCLVSGLALSKSVAGVAASVVVAVLVVGGTRGSGDGTCCGRRTGPR